VLIAALERSRPANPRCIAVLQRGDVSRDHRAARTYDAIGVNYELIA
jgi:hypothetical protein